MARIFLLLAIVLGIIWWLRDRSSPRDAANPPSRAAGQPRGASPADTDIEPMVQCAQCGVHLPRTDAIAWHGAHYCRRSHLPDSPGEGSA
ncbi:PP0621 family protein [Cupriavidus pauculus]|uniref:PP0621 family protein n=1 Tax=Cupriavidus pauculus TaxID=82633 RepID=UPI001FD29F38|nr:PP0621 family protein [Cupriavidus pauculus]